MLGIIDPKRLGYKAIDTSKLLKMEQPQCGGCAAYRPDPELDGSLIVDPEINCQAQALV